MTLEKGKHLISGLSLLISDTYISSAWWHNTITEEKERALLYLSREWEAFTSTMTASDSSVSRRQYSAYLSHWGGDSRTVEAGDEWDIAHVWYIFAVMRTNNTDIWNEYCLLKEHRHHNLFEGSRQFVHNETLHRDKVHYFGVNVAYKAQLLWLKQKHGSYIIHHNVLS